MNKRLKGTTPFVLFSVAIGLATVSRGASSNDAQRLAQKRYVDPKGHFKILPPAEWKVQDYPHDPRGKVAFTHPNSAAIDMRVLCGDMGTHTIDGIIESYKDAEARLGTKILFERTTFAGFPAVTLTYQGAGKKFYAIDFLVGRVRHNLQFGAPISEYNQWLPLTRTSFDTYEPLFKESSDAEAQQNLTANKLRLAQIMVQIGRMDLADEYVKEGLALSPNSKELRDLQQKIEKDRLK